MQALCDYADRWMGVLRIELTVYVDNAAAIALYRKFGFEIEGRYRGYALRDGALVDAFAMARLHPDPPAIAARIGRAPASMTASRSALSPLRCALLGAAWRRQERVSFPSLDGAARAGRPHRPFFAARAPRRRRRSPMFHGCGGAYDRRGRWRSGCASTRRSSTARLHVWSSIR